MKLPSDEQVLAWIKPHQNRLINLLKLKKVLFILIILTLGSAVVSYSWSYKAIGGFYDQTAWAVYGLLTNWTLGFVVFWLGTGACVSILLKKWNVRPALRPMIVAIVMFIFAYTFSLIGFEGFRW